MRLPFDFFRPGGEDAGGADQAVPALLQQAQVAIGQADASGRFTHANQRWLDLLGYTAEELRQLSVGDVTHPDSRGSTDDYLARLRAGESHVVVEKRYRRKDGSSFWAHATINALRGKGGEFDGVIGVIVEAAPRRPGRRVIEKQNEALQLIISGAPLAEVFHRLVEIVETEGDGDAVSSIFLYDADSRTLRHGAAPSLPDAYNQALDGIPVKRDVGTCVDAAARNELVFTPDIAASPGWRSFAHLPLALGLVAAWSMPIVSADGKVLGTFGTYFRRCRRPTEAEIETVALLAKTAALAIERRQSEQRLRSAVDEIARQKRLYETILSATPDFVYVFNLEHRFTYANPALLAMWGRSWEESIGRNCLELGYEPWHAAMHDREIEQVIATKQSVRGQVAFSGTNGRRFYDYIFVPVIGAGGAVEAIAGTTRDITEARKAAQDVQFLADLAQALALIGDPAEIIRRTVQAVGPHLNAHRCYFIECLASDDRIQVSENWVRDAAPSLAGAMSLFAFGGRAWWQEFAKGDFAVEDVHDHPLIGPAQVVNYDAVAVRSYAVQPIQRAGDWTVVLAVTDDQPRSWTKEELRLLENVAARVWPLVERARSEAALRTARDEALAASRAKDHFLAVLSHELRTPLNPVLLLASEAAGNAALPPAVRADFETIARNVSLEARLIDDLLDLTRIIHDKLPLNIGSHDLHALLRQVAATIEPELREKRLTFTARLDASAPVVSGDDVRLQQVFWNLLKNAVKFTPPGGAIELRTRASGQRAGWVTIEISDTGIGLTPAEIAKVFDPFAQGDHSAGGGGPGYGGLGLGLAISRRIAELHSGSLSARSEGRGRGATFTIELPLAKTAAVARPAEPERKRVLTRAVSGRRAYQRVLLVEDHEPSRVALARLLAMRQLDVVQAGSAAEALAKAQDIRFDLVISDIGLPDVDGYELMAMLRLRQGCPGIALTGYGMETDIDRSRQAGFVAHLTKPVRIQALEETLERLAQGDATAPDPV